MRSEREDIEGDKSAIAQGLANFYLISNNWILSRQTMTEKLF